MVAPALLQNVSTEARHGVVWALTLRICRIRERLDFDRTLEQLFLAEVEKHVYAAHSDVHTVERKACWVGQHVNTLDGQ